MHRLEKLNSSIDIIPIQGVAMENRRFGPAAGLAGKPTSASDIRMYQDPLITSRVKTYLYENEDKVYIDVTEMADHLQKKYRDYRGKKKGPFRALVRKAYDEITEKITRQVDTHWPDDEDEIDIESDSQMDSTMPSEYLQAYKQQMSNNKQNGNSSDKELIDISSDDDQAKTTPSTTVSRPQQQQSYESSMDIEHVSKRPHLEPNYESTSRSMISMPQDSVVEVQKSRKRPREKEFPVEVIPKKRTKDIPVTDVSVKFANIGGNTKVLETVANLLLHIKHPEVYTKLGISPPRGFLLHGPPGCGKTLLAHAIAGELEIPLLKVAAPELVAGVSGESEQRIRELFDQALAIAPCILFLDEIDAVAPHRATAQKEMEKRIVSQLLSCLDELGKKQNGNKVLVLGATNRPDSLDPALRRAGRFDREVSLGIPDRGARKSILQVHTAKVTLSSEVSLEKIASLTPGFVGADLVALIREAAMAAVNRTFNHLKKKADVHETNSMDIIIEEAPKKNDEPEIADIIIEEDSTEKTDTKTVNDEPKEDENTASLEAENKANDPLESSNISSSLTKCTELSEEILPENITKETIKETLEDLPQETSEKVSAEEVSEETQMKSVPETQLTEDSTKLVNSEITTQENATIPNSTESPECLEKNTVALVLTKSESNAEASDSMQVEEIKSSLTKTEENLKDILSWLHSEPPLSEKELALLCIEQKDFEIALKNVQPSAKREGFATVPDVTWDDIGSLQDIRQELQMTIMAPIRYSEQFASLGLNTPTGVLLCGPPGCGKTLLAKAIANEAGINFISVKGPELLNMYVGESEKAVRQCFLRARNSAPCVIFFDELDALCPKRSEGDSSATSRVVNQMLTEMDGVECRKDVFLMAASNRPDIIDPAVLRPGRLDKILYVGLPNSTDRVDILKALTKNGTKPKLSREVNLEEIALHDRCAGYTGADLAAFVREAGVEALREFMNGRPGPVEICNRHFDAAFDKVRPSVQEKDLKHYEKLKKLYSVKKNMSFMAVAPMSVEPPGESGLEEMET